MFYNLTDILSSEDKVIEIEVPFEQDTVSNGYETYAVLEKSDIHMKLTNVSKGEVQIEGNCRIVCEVPCARCLKSVHLPMELTLEEHVKESDIGDLEAAEEMPYMDGYQLDIDALLGNEIMINWPMKVLCKEDCKGICKVCGKDLNEGDCGCDSFVPDPRMAVLKDIFNA